MRASEFRYVIIGDLSKQTEESTLSLKISSISFLLSLSRYSYEAGAC